MKRMMSLLSVGSRSTTEFVPPIGIFIRSAMSF